MGSHHTITYHTSVRPAIRARARRMAEAQALGYSDAISPRRKRYATIPFPPGTDEFKAYVRGGELAAFDAKHLWPD